MLRQISTILRVLPLTNPIVLLNPSLLTHKQIFQYHPSYLMDSKNDDLFVKIDRRAFHLYRDSITKLQKDKFNEKIFILVMIDCVRTKQKYEDFEQLVQYGVSKIDQFEEILSIISFGTQLYLYNYPNKELCYKVAQKGFDLLAKIPQIKFSSFYLMKFLIFIQKCVGLEKFPDSSYSLINFQKFKALFLCFSLQMFYENKLQHYPTVEKIFGIFTSSANIIPFADIHHYKLAIKKINDPKFTKFIEQVEKQMMQSGSATFSETNRNIQKDNIKENGLQNNQLNNEEISQVEPHVNKLNTNDKQNIKKDQFRWQQIFEKQIERRYTYFASLPTKKTSKNTATFKQAKKA